ncbi:MAG: Ig-like domain-containing protein, partial [Bacteroidota bacterium]
GDQVSQDELAWTIADTDPEGEYLAQIRVYGNGQFNIAGDRKLIVDRVAPLLVSASPSDGVFGRGGEINFSFSEDLSLNEKASVSVKDESANELVGALFTFIQSGSSIAVVPTESLESLDGQTLSIEISDVYDPMNNRMEGVISSDIQIDYFTKLPSPVEIKSPDNFMVNLAANTIEVAVAGYDVFEVDHSLDSLVLLYRPLAGNQPWISIAKQDIDFLQGQNTTLPETIFEWNTASLESGDYELRVTSHADGRFQYSNVVQGVIDRIRPQVAGLPSPEDKVLDLTDQIEVAFTEDVQLSTLDATLRKASNDEEIHTEMIASPSSVNLLFSNEDRFAHIGDSLTFEVSGVVDLAGNTMTDDISWTFIVNQGEVEISDLSMSNDGWVVSKATEDQPVRVVYSDFNVITQELDSVVFEYSDENENEWHHLASKSRTELLSVQSQLSDTVLWWTKEVADGSYDIRGLVYGFGGDGIVKASISGVIDRTPPMLLVANPSDSSYQFGDEISFSFDEEIDCLSDYSYEVQLIDGDIIRSYDELSPICDVNGAVLFGPNNEALFDEKGKTVKITLS